MNVPWPASKSSVPEPSSSCSSSSSTGKVPSALGVASRQVASSMTQQSRKSVLGAARAVLDDGMQPGVEDEDLGPTAVGEVEPAAQVAGLFGRLGRRQHHLAHDAVLIRLRVEHPAEEGHLAGPGGRHPERVADDALGAEEDVVQLGDDRCVEGGELAERRLHPTRTSSAPHRSRTRARRPSTAPSRTARSLGRPARGSLRLDPCRTSRP